MRSVKGSLPKVWSGIASYMRFCDLLGRPPFPPTAETVQLWGSTFNPGRAFSQYLAHRSKASILMNMDTDWLTPTMRRVARGLKNAQDLSFKFPNFTHSTELMDRLKFVKLASDTGNAYFLSYLFSLRVPSETLRLIRAFRNKRLAEFSPQTDKALIATRTFKGVTVLVVKFAFRGNIRNGCIFMRPCLCSDQALPHDLCPVHAIWPCIRDRVEPGFPLFPGLTSNTFNRQLKATMTALRVPEGGKFPPPRLPARRDLRDKEFWLDPSNHC